MKLHIGCGTVYLQGYVNIDGLPDFLTNECPPDILAYNSTTFDKYYKQEFGSSPGIVVADIKHDIKNPLPFPDESVEEIIMYQVLEHLPHYDVGKLLKEIYRVLHFGGNFFVSVPDVKETARMLAEAEDLTLENWSIRLIHGTQRNEWSHHYCGYIPRTLKTLLSSYNFSHFEDLPNINCYPTVHLKARKMKDQQCMF